MFRNKYIRFGLIIIAILLLLLLFASILIRIPAVQNYAQQKIMQSLSDKYDADWHIDQLKISFIDQIEAQGILLMDQKSDTLLSAEQLTIDIGLFSLLGKKIAIDDIAIKNGKINLYELPDDEMNYSFAIPQSNNSDDDNDADANDTHTRWAFDIDKIKLDQIALDYKTKDTEVRLKQDALYIGIENLDLEKKVISLNKLTSQNSYTYLSLPSGSDEASSILPDMGWKVAIDNIEMYQKSVEIDGVKANHFKELNIVAQDLNYQSDSMTVDVKQLNGNYNDQINLKEGSAELKIHQEKIDATQVIFRTKDDQILADQLSLDLSKRSYDLKNLNTDISYKLLKILEPFLPEDLKLIKGEKWKAKAKQLHYDHELIQINKLDLQYGNAITLKGSFNLQALNRDFENPKSVQLNIDMLKADLHQLDGMYSAFTIPDSLQQYQYLTASGVASGRLQELNLERFSITLDDVLQATTEGTVRNINNPDALSYDLDFNNFNLNTLKAPYVSSENINVTALGQLNYVGKLSGDRTNVSLDGQLQSELGDANANVVLGIGDGLDSLSYIGNLALSKFDIGTLLKDESLGTMTLTVDVDGQGTQLQKGNTKLNGVIKDFEYRGYTYKTIKINAFVKEGQIEGFIDIDDPNAQLQYDGTLSIGEENSTFDFSMQVDTVNLLSLNLYNNDLSFSGAIQSQLSLPLSSRSNQKVLIQDLYLSNLTDNFYEDSISISALSQADSTFLIIDSDVLELNMDGIYQIADLPASFNDLAKAYIDTDTVIAHTKVSSRNIHLYGKLNTLIPLNIYLANDGLQSKPMSIDVKVDFEQNSLLGKIEVDSFYYNDFFSEHIKLNAATADKVIDVAIVGNMNTYNGTPINTLTFDNSISNSMIESTLSAIDKFDKTILMLSTHSKYNPNEIVARIQDTVILNDNEWKILSDNLIRIENDCINVSNFEMTDGLESIKVNSDLEGKEKLSVVFENFEVGEFTDLLLKNGSTTTGTINGEIDIGDLCSTPYFIVNLAVENIIYDSLAVGTLAISADSEPKNSLIKSNLSLEGPTNKVLGSANYKTSTGEIDMHLSIDSLQLLLLDPFLEDIIKDSEGYISGELDLTGTTQNPEIKGKAKLSNSLTTIVANNTKYSLHDHVINFDGSSIDIGELEIIDEEGNAAKLKGEILHDNLKNMFVDIQIETDKFIFLNTTHQENPVFHGKVYLDAQGEIIGPPSLLAVNVVAKSLPGTAITISPYSAETYLREDFITYGKPQDFNDLSDEYLLQLSQEFPFDVTLLLDVSEESKLTLVVDPINGDKVEGYGSGDLKIQLNPYGEQEFYGVYTVKEGTYTFSYGDFIFKEFEIKEGGSVVFNGDLLDAEVNIDAVHKVYTTTYELVKNEPNIDPSDLSNAQSRTNVEVYLTLVGPLSETQILLDIQVPDLESSSLISPVDNRLRDIRDDPNELNNQVFGLLIFNSFIVSQNSASGIGSIGSNLALSSISDLVSSQLNNFAQRYIKGVDVNINVNSYDSEYVNSGAGGNVTEVGLQVSKQLFNDRLSVSATGNLDFEGNDQENYSKVVGDFILEYKLTQDGRYRVRVFSKTDYDRLFNENNNKKGVSLFFKKSFDSKRNQKN